MEKARQENERQPSGRLQATLDDMKRRLEEEREAAELLTRRLTFHRDNRPDRPDNRSGGGNTRHTVSPSFSPIEAELSDARKQLNEQKAITEKWIEQVTTERDAGRARLRDSETKIQMLQDQLEAAQLKLAEQMAAAEALIQQLVAAAPASEANAAAPVAQDHFDAQPNVPDPELVQELAAVRERFSQELGSAQEQIRQLAAERDQIQAQANEVAARTQALDQELSTARQELSEQQQASEQQMLKLTADRDEAEGRLSEAQGRLTEAHAQLSDAQGQAESFSQQLEATRQELAGHQQAVEETIRNLTNERDQSRAQYSEVESRTQLLEKEFLATHEQFREQRETAMQVIRQLEMDREDTQNRLDELDAEAVRLNGELTKARNDLQHETSKVSITKEVRSEILDAVVDIQVKGQKLLDLLQAWSSKDADLNLEPESPVVVGFFDRER